MAHTTIKAVDLKPTLTRREATMLYSINHNGPVEVRELGKGGQGIVWTVQPENFATTVEMINANGGPSAWRVTAL